MLLSLYQMTIFTFGVVLERLFVASLTVSVLIVLLSLMRRKLSLELRSWMWFVCFLCLFLPFERSSLLLFGDAQVVVWKFRKSMIQTLQSFMPFLDNFVIAHLLPTLYLTGFLFFAQNFLREHRKTKHAMQNRTFSGCASWFYKGRSRIYTPVHFETAYSKEEQHMLLMHEHQHIVQHDPLLYHFFAMLQCVFWFCPVLHNGIRLFKQDRELLCDERVIQSCSARNYGFLLLKESKMQRESITAVGIASKGEHVFERISACIAPIRGNKKTFFAALCTVTFFLAVAVLGFPSIMKDVSETALAGVYPPLTVNVAAVNDNGASVKQRIKSLESYIQIQKNGISFDQKAMYDHARSLNLSSNDFVEVTYIYNIRPSWSGYYVNEQKANFLVEDIQTQKFIPFSSSTPIDEFFELIYRLL
jgi:hypothetical protein